MSRVKLLLYPFSIDRPYFEGYAWALQLCARMNASLQLFTIIPQSHDPRLSTDMVYHSLLEANGYFLQHYPDQGINPHSIPKEACIVQGEQLDEQLLLHLKSNPVDIVILDPVTTAGGAQEIANESRGVILLSKEKADGSTDQADRFLDRLRRAKLYKLPENFFETLGRDYSLFNYLRNFFGKRRQ
jgi:hypothetical protein